MRGLVLVASVLVVCLHVGESYYGPKALGIDWSKGGWAQLKNRHLGERCMYVGNGPSLNEMDFSFMDYFDVVVGVNKIFMGFDRFNWKPNYYATTNMKVIEQSREDILALDKEIVKFVRFDRWDQDDELNQRHNFVPFHSISQCSDVTCKYNRGDGKYIIEMDTCATYCNNCFCDAENYIVEGNTITYVSLQILKHMGCKSVYVVGVDHNFVQEGEPNTAQYMEGRDVNHFDPNYFANMTWDLADLASSERHYEIARDNYRAAPWCGNLFDATKGGKLQIWDKVDYTKIAHPRITIVASPSAFTGTNADIQLHVLHRWLALDPRPRVLLLGGAAGVAEAVRGMKGVQVVASDEDPSGLPLMNEVLGKAGDESDVVVVVSSDTFFEPDFTAVVRSVWHGAGDDPSAPSPTGSRFVMLGRTTRATLAEAKEAARAPECARKGRIPEPSGGGDSTTSPYVVMSSVSLEDASPLPSMAWGGDVDGGSQLLGWALANSAHSNGAPVLDASKFVTAYRLHAVDGETVEEDAPASAVATNVRALGNVLHMSRRAAAAMESADASGKEPSVEVLRALFSAAVHPELLSVPHLPCRLVEAMPEPGGMPDAAPAPPGSVDWACHPLSPDWSPQPAEEFDDVEEDDDDDDDDEEEQGGVQVKEANRQVDSNTGGVGVLVAGGDDDIENASGAGGLAVFSQMALLGVLLVYRRQAWSWLLWARQYVGAQFGIRRNDAARAQ